MNGYSLHNQQDEQTFFPVPSEGGREHNCPISAGARPPMRTRVGHQEQGRGPGKPSPDTSPALPTKPAAPAIVITTCTNLITAMPIS